MTCRRSFRPQAPFFCQNVCRTVPGFVFWCLHGKERNSLNIVPALAFPLKSVGWSSSTGRLKSEKKEPKSFLPECAIWQFTVCCYTWRLTTDHDLFNFLYRVFSQKWFWSFFLTSNGHCSSSSQRICMKNRKMISEFRSFPWKHQNTIPGTFRQTLWQNSGACGRKNHRKIIFFKCF